jgi:hypothetical protein
MLCVLPDHTVEEARTAALLPRVVCLEADIVRHDGYGTRACLEDFIRYKILASAIDKPLVVPTQRALRPIEVPLLAEMGVGAVMIGSVVTGTTVRGVAETTRAFRDVIDSLKR